MGRHIVSFKTIVDFFISIHNYDTYSQGKRKVLWEQAVKLVDECNSNVDKYIKKDDVLYCRIKKLTIERFDRWITLRSRIIKRFKETEYEFLIVEKFVKNSSYKITSIKSYQSFSNYYIKIERIYQYAITLAYRDDLIEVEL